MVRSTSTAARHGNQMEHRIGAAAQGHDRDHRILECGPGHDVSRLDISFEQFQDRIAGATTLTFLVWVFGRDAG